MSGVITILSFPNLHNLWWKWTFLFFKCPVSIPATCWKPGTTGQHCLSNISIWRLVTFVCQFYQWPILHGQTGMQAKRTSNICLLTSKNVFDSVLVNIQNAEQEMFEKFGENISKQGHAVHTISCQADLKE